MNNYPISNFAIIVNGGVGMNNTVFTNNCIVPNKNAWSNFGIFPYASRIANRPFKLLCGTKVPGKKIKVPKRVI